MGGCSRDTARRVLEIEAQAILELAPRLDESVRPGGRAPLRRTRPGRGHGHGQERHHRPEDLGHPRLHRHALAVPASGRGDPRRPGPHRQGRRRARDLLQRRHRGDPRPGAAGQAAGVAARRGHRQPALRPRRRRPTCTSTSRSARRPARSASPPPPPPPPPWPWATPSSMALLERRGFTVEDFAVLHPGGRLGKKLLRVEDVMHTGDRVPRVLPGHRHEGRPLRDDPQAPRASPPWSTPKGACWG